MSIKFLKYIPFCVNLVQITVPKFIKTSITANEYNYVIKKLLIHCKLFDEFLKYFPGHVKQHK